jgi:CRP/FNR family transcriptional activator FtrB
MMEASVRDRLRGVPLLAGIGEGTLARLAAAAAVLPVPKGAALFAEGDRAEAVHLLLSGRIALTATASGRHSTVITLLGEGDLVAVPPMLLGLPSPVGAVATMASEALALDAASLRAALADDAALDRAILGMLARHWCALIEQMKDLKLHDSRTRVARWLAESARGAAGAEIKLAAPKAMLARNLGMTPESFSRALASLEAAGAIAAAGSSIAILDRGLLELAPARQG